jgi:hypothetical protein
MQPKMHRISTEDQPSHKDAFIPTFGTFTTSSTINQNLLCVEALIFICPSVFIKLVCFGWP